MPATLKRSLSLPLVTFYGLGTILGAGIYVMVGAVAAVAGPWTPGAFLLAAVIAAVTALTYAELVRRMPDMALFAALGDEQARRVARELEVVELAAGEALPDDRAVHVVLDGALAVGAAAVGPGGHVGAVGLLLEAPAPAGAVATGP